MVLTKHDLDGSLTNLKTEFQAMLDESVNKVKEEIMNRLLEDNERLRKEVTALKTKVVELEISHQENLQYQRSENVIIKGIPGEINHDELEKTVITLFNNVCSYKITERDLVATHRLSAKTSNVISKFINRKDALALKDAYKEIDKLDYTKAGLSFCKNIKVEDHLTMYTSNLAFRCRDLVRNGKLHKTKCQRGKVKVIFDDGDTWHHISHISDLKDLVSDDNGE